MDYSSALAAVLGGVLIGASAALLLFTYKHTAGISGIAAGLLPPWPKGNVWRIWFLAGLVASAPLAKLAGADPVTELQASPTLLALAGLLVGYGSRLGGGCTSGHGVCGIARLSPRSIVATLIFMFSAGITVFLTRHWL
ncbi:YeeE/YedE thiosulfate transporter family protein [Methylomonas sp. EFPC3]|uniref:YeeE/YedE family protein n=1 Tax=Methylomonas sp. EFPC3 TaxID=3021710 RepID=UPI0024163A7F|nr:YeeE/YedE thiosulfate transporter family protein [Methylomonas sp. EFPC3]WFP50860.1 YeeE/YedE thiosulfate transporter family protein [Methylomonas sp. EFPC3]